MNKINKKKVVSICPAGLQKTKCPSIKRTRQIRVKLLTLQREKKVDIEQVKSLRAALKERKIRGIAVDCETCVYNKSASAV
jgi:hypothetical protein